MDLIQPGRAIHGNDLAQNGSHMLGNNSQILHYLARAKNGAHTACNNSQSPFFCNNSSATILLQQFFRQPPSKVGQMPPDGSHMGDATSSTLRSKTQALGQKQTYVETRPGRSKSLLEHASFSLEFAKLEDHVFF